MSWPSPNSVGVWQIIPNCGAHEQVAVTPVTAWLLANDGLIEYDPEYGPFAHVFRPVAPLTDAETVRSWL